MEDYNAYQGLTSEMRSLVDYLEEKYDRVLPGSPRLEECLLAFYHSNPENREFQKAKNLADDFASLNIAISSDGDRLDAFLCLIR